MPDWFDDLAIALIAAGVGGALVWIWRRFRVRARAVGSSRQSALDQGGLVNILHDWYRDTGQTESLYRTVAVAPGTQLPILVDGSMIFERAVSTTSDDLLTMEDQDKADPLPVDYRAVQRRKSQGAHLKDNPIVYVRGRTESTGRISLRGRYSRYFSYVTALSRIERDLALPRPERFTLLEDRYSSAPAAFERRHPLWLSGNTATVFEVGDEWLVPVQKRSTSTVNGHGQFTVLPVFGVEPVETTGLPSEFGALFHNIAREFGEELFNVEEVEDVEAMRRANPDWICEHEPINAFVRAVRDERISISATGLAINPRDENLAIGLLIRIRCDEEWTKRLKTTRANWEGDPASAIRFHDLRSPWFDEQIRSGVLYPTSAFALDRARVLYESL